MPRPASKEGKDIADILKTEKGTAYGAPFPGCISRCGIEVVMNVKRAVGGGGDFDWESRKVIMRRFARAGHS